MSRRLLVALLGALTVALAVVAGASAAGGLQLTEIKGSTFPNQQYVLALPAGTQARPEDVAVVENGAPVDGLKVSLPGGGGGQSVGVVLAIDASDSMKGDPIAQAMSAARAFAAKRTGDLQVGVLLFNGATRVLVPVTSDDAAITRALRPIPQLAFGTHIYDGIAAAQKMLSDGGIDIGSIVLLSDGADVGSSIPRAQAVAAARDARTRIFSVGLESPAFDDVALGRLSAATGGSFATAAKPKELTKIFADLGSIISNQFIVTYKSFAGPATQVFVSAKVGGLDATAVTSYTSPGLPVGLSAGNSWWDDLIQSPWLAALVSVLLVALVYVSVYLLARRRDRRLERRVLQFTAEGAEEVAAARRADVHQELLDGRTDKGSVKQLSVVSRFLDDAELAGITTPPSSLLLMVGAGSLALGLAGVLVTGTGWAILLALLGPPIARWYASFRLDRVRKAFAEQLPEMLDVLSSALRAGHSLTAALAVVVEASPEPSKSEYARALADDQLGVPLDDALRVVAQRMENRDLVQVALVARVQRESGTNAAEVLDHVSSNVRAQMDLRRLVKSLTAQGRMARWIVSFLPVVLFFLLFLLNREYLQPLWQEALGKVAMVVAACLIVIGSYVIKKIVEIEV